MDSYIVQSFNVSVVDGNRKEPSNINLGLNSGRLYQQSEILLAVEKICKITSDEFVELQIKFAKTEGAWLAIYKKGQMLAELGAHSDEELSEKANISKKIYGVNHYTLIEIELEVV